MTEYDITKIESSLGIRLPADYCHFMLSLSEQVTGIFTDTGKVVGVFLDSGQVIAANESRRQMSWLGRPLDRVFYIFGMDETGKELFLDLDFPEPPVMLADHERRRGNIQARTFGEWISQFNTVA
jgi:hypothetical protein